ncbi:hypothetical protein GCM10027569_58990 [Flindersiella endophytica]
MISAVSGTAGVGKTSLAVHWAHRVADRFPDGQLYVNLRAFEPADSPMDPSEVMRGFLEALGAEPKDNPMDLDARAARYRSFLSGKRMLIVLDNARDTDQVRPLLPGAAGCLVVVTSRSTLSGLVTREGARPLELGLFTGTEAKQLLERRLGQERVASEPEAVDGIIAACANLPLALAVVAARAEPHPEFSLTSLATDLQDTLARLDFLSVEDPDTDLRAVFSWSYEQLSDDAKRLFRLCGLHPGPDASATAIASLAAISVRKSRTLLNELTRAHLVAERVRGRYGFHDLLRTYARELVRANESIADRQGTIRRMVDYYLHASLAADRQLRPGRDPIVLVAPQHGVVTVSIAGDAEALDWFVAEHQALLGVRDEAVSAGLGAQVWQLAWTLDTYLDRQGHWDEYATSWQLALEATRRLGDRPAEARARRILAHAHLALGRLDEAYAHLQQALDILDEQGDLISQAHTYGELTRAFERQNEHRKALESIQLAFELFRVAGHRQGQAKALNDIGWIRAQIGEYELALESCEDALSLNQELGNREGEANAWDSLGYVRQHLGHSEQAIDCYRRALSLFLQLGDRHNQAETLTRLGDAHLAAGSVLAALGSWRNALEILDDLEHADQAMVRAKLAAASATAAGLEEGSISSRPAEADSP